MPNHGKGGRPKGSPNKRTVQKLIEASQQVADIKKLGQKKATETLQDLMNTAMGMVALYQRRIMTTEGLLPEAKPDDVANFWEAMKCAGTFSKALAPFQDPTFKAISVSMAPVMPAHPGDNAKQVEGKVIKMDDPNAIARVYQQMVRRVS
jgi:hypothetical protein